MEITYINFISHFISKFETPLTLPSQNIHSLRKDIEKCLYDRSFAISKKDIERAASIARKKLGVSENKELLYRLELSGIYILEKSMGLSIDAYSTWTNKDIPFLYLVLKKNLLCVVILTLLMSWDICSCISISIWIVLIKKN